LCVGVLSQNVATNFGTRRQHTTPHHPQTNDYLEKFNDILTNVGKDDHPAKTDPVGQLSARCLAHASRPSRFVDRCVTVLPYVWQGTALTNQKDPRDHPKGSHRPRGWIAPEETSSTFRIWPSIGRRQARSPKQEWQEQCCNDEKTIERTPWALEILY